jgi:la-related protein 1
MGELADFAKRIGCVKEAREVFAQMRSLQPSSQHAWLESAKMEEELGCIEQCEELLLQGLMQCPQSDSILLKAVKLQEKLGNLRVARSLLSRMKLIPVERAWRVILEGALLETRAGNLTVARKVFKYLIKSVPWYGPIYCDMCAVHERESDWLRAEKIVACGLTNIPRYGPLWLCAMRVCERKFMLPANGKPLLNAAQLVCDQTRKIATQALQLMGSKELVWKLLMQAAQCEARAGNLDSWRSAVASAALSVPDNLRWKVWSAAAKLELACGDASLCMPLLERALQVCFLFNAFSFSCSLWQMCNKSTPQECSTKTRSVVLLDKAKCLEIQGQIDAARASFIEANHDSKDWRFEFDRIMFEARQGAAHEQLQARVEEAVDVYPASGRLWALCVQLQRSDAEKTRQFKKALGSVPKSGELWCEGARMLLQPHSKLFNPVLAMERLVMAANFTPQ